MALSIFEDKSCEPSLEALQAALGEAAPLWERLVTQVGSLCPPITPVWNFAGARFGWSLRLKRKDRIILYLTPQAGQLLVGVVLGEKAVQRGIETGLAEPLQALLEAAPRYAEGRGVRLTVTTEEDLAHALQLAALKVGG